MNVRPFAFIAAIMLLPAVAYAQEAQPACAGAPPPELAGWAAKSEIGTATRAAGLNKAELGLGQAVTATLHQTPEVSYAAQPAKPGGTVSYGGMLKLRIGTAGTYRVGVGSGAWIDVLKGKKPIVSSAHGHGPACTTIRKIIDFPLQPGRYVLQISANTDPTVDLMVWRQP